MPYFLKKVISYKRKNLRKPIFYYIFLMHFFRKNEQFFTQTNQVNVSLVLENIVLYFFRNSRQASKKNSYKKNIFQMVF